MVKLLCSLVFVLTLGLGVSFADQCHESFSDPAFDAFQAHNFFDAPFYRYYSYLTMSTFTLTYDPKTGQSMVSIVDSSGRFIPVDANDVDGFLESNCPGEFSNTNVRRRLAGAAASSPVLGSAGQAAQGVVSGDFNGDGLSDAAVVTRLGVSIYLAQANGAARAPVSYGVNNNTEQAIVTADFNGDGKLDLAVLVDGPSGAAGSVAIFFGAGDGTFGAASYAPAGVLGLQIATADFNGDGKADLVVYGGLANQGSSLTVLLGKGDGTFLASTARQTTPLQSLVAVDVNGDGAADVLAAYQNQILFFRGNRDGTLAAPVASVTGGNAPYLAYTDLNHDGKPDALIGDRNLSALLVLFGNGDGTFQPAQVYAAPGLMQSFAVLPLRDGNTAFLLPARQAGALLLAAADSQGKVGLPKLQITGPAVAGQVPFALVGDLNGDGKPDIVSASASGVAVRLNNGDGTFASLPYMAFPAGTTLTSADLADVNRDKRLDLVFTGSNGATVLPGKGDGTFGTALTGGGGQLLAAAVADFDGDGWPDIAAGDGNGGISVLLSKSDGTFQAPKQIALNRSAGDFGRPISLVAGDFTGDGKADLVAAYVNTAGGMQTSNVVLIAGRGDGSFQAPAVIPGAAFTAFIENLSLAAGDLDGDGKQDFVFTASDGDNDRLGVFLSNNDGTFRSPPYVLTTASLSGVTIGDLNRDGKADLLLNNQSVHLLGNGDGTFQAETPFLAGPAPASYGVADFVAVASAAGGVNTLTVLRYQGVAALAPPSLVVISAANSALKAVAPGSIASAFGSNLGGTVTVVDAKGASGNAQVLFSSASQVNFLVPATVSVGAATVTISGSGTSSSATVTVAAVAPGLFTLNAGGLAAANVILVSGGTQTPEDVYSVTPAGAIVANPINLGGPGDSAVLVLFGTGLQAAGSSGVSVSIGGVPAQVQYAGPQGAFVGLDQVNVVIPASLAGKGAVSVQVSANGIAANAVSITVR